MTIDEGNVHFAPMTVEHRLCAEMALGRLAARFDQTSQGFFDTTGHTQTVLNTLPGKSDSPTSNVSDDCRSRRASVAFCSNSRMKTRGPEYRLPDNTPITPRKSTWNLWSWDIMKTSAPAPFTKKTAALLLHLGPAFLAIEWVMG